MAIYKTLFTLFIFEFVPKYVISKFYKKLSNYNYLFCNKIDSNYLYKANKNYVKFWKL